MSSAQIATAVAGASGSDSLNADNYVVDFSGAKQKQKAALEAQMKSAIANLTSIVASVNSFDAATSGDLVNAGGGVTAPFVDGSGTLAWSNGNPKAISGADASGLAAWKATWWADGGLEDRMIAANEAVKSFRAKLSSYAKGGSHSGGLRLVGENGPELEVTGPSRIYSAGQTQNMLGAANDELIAEVRALRQQMAETNTWAKKTAESTTTTAKGTKQALSVGWGTGV